MEAPLLFWRGKSLTVAITQYTPSTHSGNADVSTCTLWTQTTTCSWSTRDRKLYSFQLQLLSAGITARYYRYQWKSLRNRCVLAEWVTVSKPTAQSRLCSQWLGVNKTSLSARFLFFFLCVCMRLQTTFLLGHLSTAEHIFSIPWSGAPDNIKPVNCSNCHKGRAVAVVKSFLGDAHHMDHLLLDNSSWSHQTFNHPREYMFKVKLLRNFPANLHKIVNACMLPKQLTHYVNTVIV